MTYQDAAQSALRASLALIYPDGTLTRGGAHTLDARGGFSTAQGTAASVKLQRETKDETLVAANVQPDQAMFYVLSETAKGDLITFDGEVWKVASLKARDPLGVAWPCVCDKIGDAS